MNTKHRGIALIDPSGWDDKLVSKYNHLLQDLRVLRFALNEIAALEDVKVTSTATKNLRRQMKRVQNRLNKVEKQLLGG